MMKKFWKRLVILLMAMVLAVPVTFVLPQVTTTTVQAATPRLTKTKVSVYIGKSKTLKVKKAGKAKIKWSSSDKKIVKVNKKGKITGISEGRAYIYAKVKGSFLCCAVTVKLNVKDAKKKIAISYDQTEDGKITVAIMKNKNPFAVSVDAHMYFYDKSGKVIDTAHDHNYCLGSKQTTVLYFYRVNSSDYQPSSRYKMSYDLSLSDYTDYSNKIKTTYKYGENGIIATIKNMAGKELDWAKVTCLMYDSTGNLINANWEFPNCRKKGGVDNDCKFSYPVILHENTYDANIPAVVKIYVDEAYRFKWH